MKKIHLILISLFLVAFSGTALAHQPRNPEGNEIVISDPEISKAFYSKLDGEPHIYIISSDTPFVLYVNVLVPDIPNQKKDLYVKIVKDRDVDNPLSILDGNNYEWTKFFEPFGHDSYWMGPEYESDVESGEYQIIVSSENNDTKYSLATGKIETFDFKESINALTMIPKNKREFFEKSPIDFILSPFGWGLIIVMFTLAFVFGFIYRLILKRLAKNNIRKRHKNIGWKDRVIRLVLAVILFVIAITTSWSPILLFFSGFTLFEAIFSWCGFYAAIGKNSCPI
ncbi:DUF2892 domain-containing protein [Patescibacteria group bacterium]